MRRTLIPAALVACMMAVMVVPASAAKPIMDRGGAIEYDINLPAGAVCEFPVDVHVAQKTKTTTFVDRNGDPTRGISTGQIHVWETNGTTGKTVFSSISGPSFFDASGALVWGTGGWSGIQLQDGTWIHAHGLIAFDENSLVSWVRGHVEPLCDVLA